MDGPTLVWIFLGAFALAIVQGIVRRRLNPFGDVPYERVPAAVRAEIERLLSGFSPSSVRRTRRGDEVRLEGRCRGELYRVELEFAADGSLRELEVDGPRSSAVRALARIDDLSAPARSELERVLADDVTGFQPHLVKSGASDGEPHHEVKGRSGDWKWEVTVSQSGRLLALEKETRAARA